MPRGKPKQPILVRLNPELIAEIRGHTENFTGAVEEGLALWLKQARHKADLLAKRRASPPARKRAAA